ncbi:MAG: heme exporter protein CcmB [Thiotrichales bacterium]|jgi:heme exporter protein B|nr:heme exporter protein CcmB [Thiotrichales bacterium]MBT3613056.1 heme exporter protein CcmB [Thiotrichales bacterium]MBT3751958.1 heme exporter protein CcmB [Thiotrichales bacterium]MBT3837662.1 heme exporter protein CcmB [Thiotrichales bacterium]MBT4152300.1 heme exporter protein CcmB [Thiotrichales bacterium]
MANNSLSSVFFQVLKRDLTLAFRHRGEIANPLLFFIIVVSLFPLGVGPTPSTLETIAPGIIWVAALLSAMLSLDGMFRSDFEDGSLEQITMSHHPLSVLVLAKILAHWLITGLPLLFAAPLLGVLLYLPSEAMKTLVITLALGTPILSLVGAIGMGLTVGLKRGGVLLSLLVLPLYIPVLIFGSMAVNEAAAGLAVDGYIYILSALLMFTLSLSPIATAASIRISTS